VSSHSNEIVLPNNEQTCLNFFPGEIRRVTCVQWFSCTPSPWDNKLQSPILGRQKCGVIFTGFSQYQFLGWKRGKYSWMLRSSFLIHKVNYSFVYSVSMGLKIAFKRVQNKNLGSWFVNLLTANKKIGSWVQYDLPSFPFWSQLTRRGPFAFMADCGAPCHVATSDARNCYGYSFSFRTGQCGLLFQAIRY